MYPASPLTSASWASAVRNSRLRMYGRRRTVETRGWISPAPRLMPCPTRLPMQSWSIPASTGVPGRVYVGTDVGVFWSFTAAPNWQELGPPPNSGQAGYLPNVAVTALGIFTRSDSTKLLRASTYGRGVWEFPLTPDFSISISNTPITIFAGQVPPMFNGTITALGGYNSLVNLSCIPASTCLVAPTQVTPAPPPLGTPLTATVTPGNTPGDYSFDVHGAGTDPNRITNDVCFYVEGGGLQSDRLLRPPVSPWLRRAFPRQFRFR